MLTIDEIIKLPIGQVIRAKGLILCAFKKGIYKDGMNHLLFHSLPPVVVLLPPWVVVLEAGDRSQRLGAEAAGLHEHLAEVQTHHYAGTGL